MIEKVQFRNFKAYRSLDMELEPLTVLVGPNASGKTTFLEGLSLIAQTAENLMVGGKHYWSGPPIQAQGQAAPAELNVLGTWSGNVASAQVTATQDEGLPDEEKLRSLQYRIKGEWSGAKFWAGSWPETQGMDNIGTASLYGNVFKYSIEEFRKKLSATAVLRFEPARLAAASYSKLAVPRVERDGSGLSSVLAYLKLSRDEVFDEIETALSQIVPAVKRIRVERAPVEQTIVRMFGLDEQRHPVAEKQEIWGDKLVLDMDGARGVSADSAGEGTLMVLGLLAVLMTPPRPKLILLDDIELSLHPAAQMRLVGVLKAIQKSDPGLQIVATSHSPFILNYLDSREVRMTFLMEEQGAQCKKLEAHPDFERWKGLMSPGEFWSAVGESWIGKRSVPSSHE